MIYYIGEVVELDKPKLGTQQEVDQLVTARMSADEKKSYFQAGISGSASGATLLFAIKLKQLREDKGLSQVELSDLSGVQQREISRIENFKANPTLNTCQKLLIALDAELKVIAN